MRIEGKLPFPKILDFLVDLELASLSMIQVVPNYILPALRNPHLQRGTVGGAADRAVTRKGGIAKCNKEFQVRVLMRELLIQCTENAGITWI